MKEYENVHFFVAVVFRVLPMRKVFGFWLFWCVVFGAIVSFAIANGKVVDKTKTINFRKKNENIRYRSKELE